MVGCIPFPVASLGILLTLFVLVALRSILFLVGSLGRWVWGRSHNPTNASLGIIGLFVWRILSNVVGILWGGDFSPLWGFIHFILRLFVVFRIPLLSIVIWRWICGHLGFWWQWAIGCSRSILSPSQSLVAWWQTMGILRSCVEDPIWLERTACWCIFLLFRLPSLNRRLCHLSDLWCHLHWRLFEGWLIF